MLLERLITKVMQITMNIVEKDIGKATEAIKDVPKKTDSHLHAGNNLAVQTERKKIPFFANPHRKTDVQNKEQPKQKSTIAVKRSVPVASKRLETERPPKPEPSILASKYPRLKEIDNRIKEQNKAIFEREKKRNKLKKELSKCTGIFKGGRRKELQQEIDGIDIQILMWYKKS